MTVPAGPPRGPRALQKWASSRADHELRTRVPGLGRSPRRREGTQVLTTVRMRGDATGIHLSLRSSRPSSWSRTSLTLGSPGPADAMRMRSTRQGTHSRKDHRNTKAPFS